MGNPDVLVVPPRVRNVLPGRLVAYFGTKIADFETKRQFVIANSKTTLP
jgi:hypothetical protein